MTTIDQTASELQLHRVLYVIKFLRAMVLHVALAATGAALYFLAGIDAYPVGTAFLQAVRAQAIDNRLQGRPGTGLGFALAVLLVFAAFLALLVWIYRSITNVRPFALRLQAVLVLGAGLFSLQSGVPGLGFAFEHLSPVFSALAAASLAMTTVVLPASVAIALAGVSRLKDRSSMLATLDSRLAPGVWAYLAKLLDLPRTPLRSLRTTCAFALALAGALLMIASLVFLITAGGASNKLSTLATIAPYDLIQESIHASSVEARRILWLLPLALAGVKAAALLQSTAKRLGGLGLSDVITSSRDRFVLYLRPFDLDEVILPKPRLSLGNRLFSFRPYPVRIEEELFDVADGYRPLVAIGKPGSAGAARGGLAYRTFLDDSEWRGIVADKIRLADRIVMVIKQTPGVQWEIDRILAEGATGKTLFFFHPEVKDPTAWAAARSTILQALKQSGMVPQDFEFASQPIGFYFRSDVLVEIVNDNWSATSYRTAFSHVLAESTQA